MTFLDEFKKTLLPGNYALTKSMEISKSTSTGTLWYVKKFLVWYYIIFLSNKLGTNAYITDAKDSFESFISDMDGEERAQAESFFFPEKEIINCRSDKFRSFTTFMGNPVFQDEAERSKHVLLSKKYYFASIMESGGQSGVKKHIKDEHLYREDFNVTELPSIIRNFDGNANVLQMINDYHAFIRNERQILYYYGIFHSKSNGANDIEFSSLTPIGDLCVKATSKELQCIWEHQKIKLVSQPVTVEINNCSAVPHAEYFGISYSPYLDILEVLSNRGSLSFEEYQYIVSRKKESLNNNEWIQNYQTIIDDIQKIKSKISAFNRVRDTETEDSRKELLKYIQGIVDNRKDDGNNILSLCSVNNAKVTVTNADKLNTLVDFYKRIEQYKKYRYNSLFRKCEDELRKNYVKACSGQLDKVTVDDVDPVTKIDWDLYNIRPDIFIMIGVAVSIANANDVGTHSNVEELTTFVQKYYSNLFRQLGYGSATKIEELVTEYVLDSALGQYDYFMPKDEYQSDIKAEYLEEETEALFVKIKASSSTPSQSTTARIRNTNLISQLKSYYIQRFKNDDSLLKCECCGNTTFLTVAGEPYVEFHHLIPFGGGYDGPDHYLNLFAVCPTCHRKIHLLSIPEKRIIYSGLDVNNYLQMCIVDRLIELKQQNILRSYQLEFLLADNAISQDDYNRIVA